MNMICVVLFSVTNLFFYKEVVGFQQIRVIVPPDNLKVRQNQHFEVLEENLDIILENNENDISAYDLRCFKIENNRNAPSSPQRTESYLIAKLSYEYNRDNKKMFTRLQITADKIPAGTITQWHCEMKNNEQDQFVQFEIKVKETNRTEIRINVPINISEVGDVKQFVVHKQQPLHIILANDKKNVSANNVSCLKYKDLTPINIADTTYHFNTTTKKFTTKLHISADKITKDVSTKWKCNFEICKENGNINKLSVQFVIRVKGAKTVQVNLGTQLLPFMMTNLSVLTYDGLYEYTFIEGETIDLICSDMNGGRLRLEYRDKQGTLFKKTSGALPLRFRYTLTSENNQWYVDCTVIQEDNVSEQEFTYRILFTARNSYRTEVIPMNVKTNNGIIITINDKIPTLINDNRSSLNIKVYEYEFVDGEMLTVTCSVEDKRPSNDVIFVFDEKSNAAHSKEFKNGTYSSILLDTNGSENSRIKCYSSDKPNISSIVEFHAKMNDENPVALIVGCVTAILVIVLAIYVYCWYVKIKYTGSTERLNESFSQQSFVNPIPPFPSQRENLGNYDYAYVENEYNYILQDEVMLNNALYHRHTQNGQNRITASEKDYSEIDESFQFNNRPVPYECHVINKNHATMSEHQYEILKKENITNTNTSNMPKILNNINYSNVSKELSNTASDVSKEPSNVLKLKPSYENVSIEISNADVAKEKTLSE